MSASTVTDSPPAQWSLCSATLADAFSLSGRGLHTGKTTRIRLLPAESGGIVFHRALPEGVVTIPVDPKLWIKQPLCSTLQTREGVTIRTVEHILAALMMAQIDHAVVEMDGEEIPILDGGASAWLRLLEKCGKRPLEAKKRFIRLTRPFIRTFGDRSNYTLEPAHAFQVEAHIFMPGFGPMHYATEINPLTFAQDIAPARSYGHIKWALPAILGGYASGTPILRGVRPSCVAAILGNRVLGGMTVPDEFIRHRILDLVGDFALAGAPLLAKVTVQAPSHRRNWRVISSLLKNPKHWKWQTFA